MSLIQRSKNPLAYGPKVCLLGDSMQDTAFLSTATAKSFRNYAMPTWVRFLTRQRVDISFDGNFAVSGDTLEQIAVRTPLVLAANPDLVIFNGGTNDLVIATPFDNMRSTLMLKIILPLVNAGIPVIITPITPRPSLTAAQRILMAAYNTFLRELCFGDNNSYLLSGVTSGFKSSLLRFADPTPYMVDYASATGEPLANMIRDTVHTNANGAYWYGLAVANVINQLLPPLGTQILHPADVYDSGNNNRRGNMIRSGTTNQGLMAGTAGTATPSAGFSFTGVNIATNWTVARTAGSSTMQCNATKENPRTDGPNSGERQRLQFTGSTTGLALETCRIRWSPTFAIGGGDMQAGDTVYGEIGLQVVSAVNLKGIELALVAFGGAGFNAFDMAIDNPGSDLYPNVATYGIMRTEPFTIGNDTSMTFAVNFNFKTDVAAASCDVYVFDAALRKVA